jgi:hypothetical protein
LKYIVTAADNLVHSPGSLITGGVFSITTPASLKVKITGNGVRKGAQSFTFSGGSDTGALFVPGSIATVAPVSLNPTALKVKAEGSAVILDGDSVIMNCSGTLLSTGNPSPISGSVKFPSSQNKVQAN